MSKKVLAILLALVMVIGMLPVAALAAPIPETAEREQVERVEADLAQAISASEAPMVADVMEADPAAAEAAQVGDDTYASVAAAIAAIAGEGTVKLAADVTEDVVIPAGKTITLDLNGQTLTNKAGHTILVEKDAVLVVEGKGTVDNVSHARAALFNNGTVTLNGGAYTRSQENGQSKADSGNNSYYNIVNRGALMTINAGVTVSQSGHFSSMIENGYQNYGAEYKAAVNAAKPKLVINGGSFTGGLNTVKNDDGGEIEINGGAFKNVSQACFLNWNEATVNGGTFDATNSACSAAVLNGSCDATNDKGQLTLNGGTFSVAAGKQVVNKMSGSDDNGTVTVTGGLYSTMDGLTVDASCTTLTVGDKQQVMPTGSAAYIQGKTGYTSFYDAVNAAENGEIVVMLKDVSDLYYFSVEDKAIGIMSGSYGFMAEGKKIGVADAILNLAENTDGFAMIASVGVIVGDLKNISEVLKNKGSTTEPIVGGVTSNSFVTKMGASSPGNLAIYLIQDVTLKDDIVLPSYNSRSATMYAFKNVTLDLNGKTITQLAGDGNNVGVFTVFNNATLTVKDSSEEGTGVVKGARDVADVQDGTLKLESGTLYSRGMEYAPWDNLCDSVWMATSGAKFVMTGGTLTCDMKEPAGDYYGAIGLRSTAGGCNIEISGGEIIYPAGKPIIYDAKLGSNYTAKISGGTFSNDASKYCAKGYEMVQITEGENAGKYQVKKVYGAVTALTPGGKVYEGWPDENSVSVYYEAKEGEDKFVLPWHPANDSIGRDVDGWWVGIQVAPASYATENAQYRRVGETEWKALSDGQIWGAMNPTIQDNANKAHDWASYSYEYDWDGDGTADQTVYLNLHANSFVLDPGKGSVTAITPTGTVSDDGSTILMEHCTVDFYPQNTGIGRWQDGFWVGVKIIQPAGYVDGLNAKYGYSADAMTKDWNSARDGADYMGAWLPVNYATLKAFRDAKAAKTHDGIMTWNYYFDWNNDGVADQHMVIRVDSATVTLTDCTGEHAWDAGVETQAVSCTQNGEMTYTCTVCGATKVETSAAATGHKTFRNYNTETHWDQCLNCGAHLNETAHTYATSGNMGVTPNCHDTVSMIYPCTGTGCEHFKTETIPALEHVWGDWITDTEAGCETAGAKHRVCTLCGDREGGTIDATGHSLTKTEAVPATCTEDGNIEYWVCDNCDAIFSDAAGTTVITSVVDPAKDHDASTEWQFDDDQHWLPCGRGGHNIVDKADHTWNAGVVTTEAAVGVAGVMTYTCTTCHATRTEAIDALPTPPAPPTPPAVDPTPVEPEAPAEEPEELVEEEVPLSDITASKLYADVKDDVWYAEAVVFVSSEGLFKGTDKGFEPTIAMTRGMIMTVLARREGVNTNTGAIWYEAGMKWAVEADISDGTAPESIATREQLVLMLYRYMKAEPVDDVDLSEFEDVDQVSSWALDAVKWAVANGIIKGRDGVKLAPQGEASRAEVAVILQRLFQGETII